MKIGLHYGALAPPLKKQLEEQGFVASPKDLARWQANADSINRLYLHSLLTDAEKAKALVRLQKHIAAGVAPVGAVAK